MITSSGAEGIDLKNTRYVHIMEPYWHHVRINQVIGRARRICSHTDLEPEYRNVKIYLYMSLFPLNMDKEIFSILVVKDEYKTTDEMLYNIMERKRKLSKMFLDTIKEASIDCIVNYKNENPENVCFSKSFTTRKDKLITGIDYKKDPLHKQEGIKVRAEIIKKKVLTGDKMITYAYDKTNNILYDYLTFLSEPLKVGHIENDMAILD
jgi:hypothetical protein